VLVGVPVKPFGVAKARLAPLLDAKERAALGISIAARTVGIAAETAEAVVVTGDDGVAEWASGLGVAAIPEGAGGLDGAARAVVDHAGDRPWIVLHADLPRVTTDDLFAAIEALAATGEVIAPSWDGGTSLLGGRGMRPFAYGSGSFHAHLRRTPRARVLVRPGLALDLDTPADYRAWRRWSNVRVGGA
jgi:2-phospho-L-lactate guanylyltransferase